MVSISKYITFFSQIDNKAKNKGREESMKLRITLISVILVTVMVLASGCGNKKSSGNETDAVSSASLVSDEASFLKAAGKDGTWIICALNDLEIKQEIVLEGAFTNRDQPARKIALYTQDADRNVTARFKLTAPKLTVKSENASIQNGTFVGDVFVEAKGFSVVGATIEGNVYFANEEAQSTFKLENNGKVTGVTELKK